MNSCAKLKVHGVVQGVSFRSFTKRHAEQLGLKGYVKNLGDGTVEVFVEGEKNKIESLIELLHNGPEKATVHKIDIEWIAYTGLFKDFRIIY